MHLEVYSRRWGHPDRYTITKTATGWDVHHLSIGGQCDKQGKPYLFDNLTHDSIDYPADLGGYLEFLWMEADSAGMNDAEIQKHLDALGAWIQAVEKSAPGGLWASYK